MDIALRKNLIISYKITIYINNDNIYIVIEAKHLLITCYLFTINILMPT
jgi:hypothetical protein